MAEHIIWALGLIILAGGVAYWLAWRFHWPSILLLLIFGFLLGPLTGVLRPDEIFGDQLFPLVSLAVAIILFEGGLSLRFSDIKGHGRTVSHLIGYGAVVGWLLTALLAFWLLGLDWRLSALLAAVLAVSGPTVVVPLLRHVRPSPHTGSILRWEGILVDPIGAQACYRGQIAGRVEAGLDLGPRFRRVAVGVDDDVVHRQRLEQAQAPL